MIPIKYQERERKRSAVGDLEIRSHSKIIFNGAAAEAKEILIQLFFLSFIKNFLIIFRFSKLCVWGSHLDVAIWFFLFRYVVLQYGVRGNMQSDTPPPPKEQQIPNHESVGWVLVTQSDK